jgi:hypothetical protein
MRGSLAPESVDGVAPARGPAAQVYSGIRDELGPLKTVPQRSAADRDGRDSIEAIQCKQPAGLLR